MELPLAPIERLLKKAGAVRVSEGAKIALAKEVESYAIKLAKKSNEIANNAGRKTIKAEDIKLAVNSIK
ncbi:MAG: histone family protein [Archaeoglobaceae archaeon]|nr:histone family protein [Archaeoglobaceae archaeon]